MKKQKGYSQVEVLVSVLVLAIGFLGMAGLQTTSLQNAQKSVLRTQAAYLSYEILDRMRANAGVDYSTGIAEFPAAETNCTSAACGTGDLKNFDVAQWKCALGSTNAACAGDKVSSSVFTTDNALPNGHGSIAANLATGVVTISLYWLEERDDVPVFDADNPGDYETFTLTTRI